MVKNPDIEQLEEKYPAFFAIRDGILTLKGLPKLPDLKLIFVKGGYLNLSSIELKDKDELKVWVDSFLIAEFPVTQRLYQEIRGTNPSHFRGEKRPVENITWYEAVYFCNMLNTKCEIDEYNKDRNSLSPNGEITGSFSDFMGFRLPTEAEWAYAAKGGSLQKEGEYFQFAGSNNANHVAWYEGNSSYVTKPVGLKFPNQMGIYDMSGNVFEWCWDWYKADFFNKQDMKNPVNNEKSTSRVLRGGSAVGGKETCLLIKRNSDAPNGKWTNGGFRLLFSI